MFIYFIKKGFLDKTIKMCGDKWKWFFCGFTFRQCGFGFIWRKRI